ncbi:hypothetical protein GCK72_017595 [Caenorhabditis remanei]|uniref:Uncharacterized protein n=2 Tax=Caenorhabditis remanei TaxID=31234 RepID=E3LTT2_CAERE|nr:hypothetical protein GCK72_017595 [Caenorhabditis remanei]EFP11071.1 hypothetical protein CRE_30700 [Caenorhabditis remanei]KAF1751043.1 hypothetical protein GCK72_017595 [Caenorhabditis remanei]
MSEKTRNLMLKNSTPSSSQHHISNSVPLNVFRGTSLITQLEQQKYPTSFTAVASDFDNIIVPSCPNISIPTQTADSTTDS